MTLVEAHTGFGARTARMRKQVGALAGLVYLRLLGKSVDSLGGGMGSISAQPRLLIPLILALVYNR